jgi:hypothetical protein
MLRKYAIAVEDVLAAAQRAPDHLHDRKNKWID